MNCHRPDAPAGEYARTRNALSTTGNKANSMGIPRCSTSRTMYAKYGRARWVRRRRYFGCFRYQLISRLTREFIECGKANPSRMRAHESRSIAASLSARGSGHIVAASPPSMPMAVGSIGTGGRFLTAGSWLRPLRAVASIGGGPGSLHPVSGTGGPDFAFAGMSGTNGCDVHPASTSEIDRSAAGTQAHAGVPSRREEEIRMVDATQSGVPVPGVIRSSGGCGVVRNAMDRHRIGQEHGQINPLRQVDQHDFAA